MISAKLINLVPEITTPKVLAKTPLSFAKVMSQKKTTKTQPSSMLTKLWHDMSINHEKAVTSVNKAITTVDHSPENLLKLQYTTSMRLLREQMFCKTAELSANSVKGFTQMQV